jgi:uncharacterized protein
MKAKISLVTLGVESVRRSAEFYTAIGFPVRDKIEEDFVMLPLEGTWLALYPRERLADDITIESTGSGFSGITLAHCVKSKEAVNDAMTEAVKAGARIVKPPQEAEWGGYSGYFADPDGHLWEVAWNPFTDLT